MEALTVAGQTELREREQQVLDGLQQQQKTLQDHKTTTDRANHLTSLLHSS